jgi:hypothetical protein
MRGDRFARCLRRGNRIWIEPKLPGHQALTLPLETNRSPFTTLCHRRRAPCGVGLSESRYRQRARERACWIQQAAPGYDGLNLSF